MDTPRLLTGRRGDFSPRGREMYFPVVVRHVQHAFMNGVHLGLDGAESSLGGWGVDKSLEKSSRLDLDLSLRQEIKWPDLVTAPAP